MKICVFGAASEHIDGSYIKAVENLGKLIAANGHSLVFGAGGTGLMGAAARGVKAGGGYIHGIVPEFFKDKGIEALYDKCDKVTYTETMRERKALMEDEADAFVIVPGGVGTFEEFFEVVTLKQLGRHDKAIVIYDINNYYVDLEHFLHTAEDRKFISHGCKRLYEYFTTAEQTLAFIENYVPEDINIQKTKLGE